MPQQQESSSESYLSSFDSSESFPVQIFRESDVGIFQTSSLHTIHSVLIIYRRLVIPSTNFSRFQPKNGCQAYDSTINVGDFTTCDIGKFSLFFRKIFFFSFLDKPCLVILNTEPMSTFNTESSIPSRDCLYIALVVHKKVSKRIDRMIIHTVFNWKFTVSCRRCQVRIMIALHRFNQSCALWIDG